MSIFREVDFDLISNSIDEVDRQSKKKEFVEVPFGEYRVKVNKIELRESKKGLPMAFINYKITAGEYEGQYISQFQTLTQSFQFKILFGILNSLQSTVEIDSKKIFSGTAEEVEDNLRFLITDILTDVVDVRGLLYTLNYFENTKGFKEFKVVEVIEELPF
jgi:hypothetical protein